MTDDEPEPGYRSVTNIRLGPDLLSNTRRNLIFAEEEIERLEAKLARDRKVFWTGLPFCIAIALATNWWFG